MLYVGIGEKGTKLLVGLSLLLSHAITIALQALGQRLARSQPHDQSRFKHVTRMAPIQFVKSMRLNNAAMKIASGMTVSQAAGEVGYVSPSQFSREFKRLYGHSPRAWGNAQQIPIGST